MIKCPVVGRPGRTLIFNHHKVWYMSVCVLHCGKDTFLSYYNDEASNSTALSCSHAGRSPLIDAGRQETQITQLRPYNGLAARGVQTRMEAN